MRKSRAGQFPGMVFLALVAGTVWAAPVPPASIPPSPLAPDNSQIRFTVAEAPLLEWLRAATPFVVTVGNQMVGTDLILLEPSDLRLLDGKMSLKIRVKGKTLPIDQPLAPEITLTYDKSQSKYYGVLSSLPLTLPGLGTIDLKEYVPRFEIPTLLENFWRFADKPIGLNLRIRKIAIVEHALEMGADVNFAPIPQGGTHSAR